MTTTFENVKFHDRVWHISWGWGTVVKCNHYYENDMCSYLQMRGWEMCDVSLDGKEVKFRRKKETIFIDATHLPNCPVPPRKAYFDDIEVEDLYYITEDGGKTLHRVEIKVVCDNWICYKHLSTEIEITIHYQTFKNKIYSKL